MRNILKKLPTSTLTFFAGILIATLVTQVLAHGGDTNLIHGCVKNTSGIVRIVGVNGTCSNGETALDWSKGSLFSTYPVCPNCDLTSKVLTGLDLTRAYFINAKLNGLDLSNTILTNAILTEAELNNTNLSHANLSNIYTNHTKIADANLTDANLAGSFLSFVQLTNANFTGANLTNIYWEGTDNDVSFANFTNANLSGSLYFGQQTKRSGVIWSNTICPDGTNSDSNGGTCEGHF